MIKETKGVMKNISNYLHKKRFFFPKKRITLGNEKKETLNFKTNSIREQNNYNWKKNKLVNQKLGYKNLPRMQCRKLKQGKILKRG